MCNDLMCNILNHVSTYSYFWRMKKLAKTNAAIYRVHFHIKLPRRSAAAQYANEGISDYHRLLLLLLQCRPA